MLIKRPDPIVPSEITPRSVHARRREFVQIAGAAALLGAAGMLPRGASAQDRTLGLQKLERVGKSSFSTSEPPTPYRHVTGYNNYYEFGTDKEQPALLAGRLKLRPWTIAVEGEVEKPRTLGIEEILRFPLEERVYRLRCVEA